MYVICMSSDVYKYRMYIPIMFIVKTNTIHCTDSDDKRVVSVSKQFSFRFDDILYAKTKAIAKKETRSMSNLIQHLCQLKIEEFEAKHGEIKLTDEDLADA